MKRSLLFRALVSGIGLALLLTVLVVGVVDAARTHASATRWADRSADVMAVAQQSERELVDLETGVRGYAATGDRLFLAPWYAALNDLPTQLDRLQTLVSVNPQQLRRTLALRGAVDEYVNGFMTPFVQQRRPLRGPALLAFLRRGKVLLDGMRARYTVLDRTERRLQAMRDRRSQAAETRFVILSIVAGGLMLAGVLSFLWFIVARVVLPLRRTVDACAHIADGDGEVTLPVTGAAELAQLAESFNRMLWQLRTREHERREAAARAEEMLELHETVIASLHHAYVAFDESGTITAWNPAAEQAFGAPRRDVIGRRTIADFIPQHLPAPSTEPPQDDADRGDLREAVAVRADGAEFPAELTIAVALHRGRPTYHALVTDISGRLAGEQELRLLARVVEQSEDAIFTRSAEGIITSWNRGAERLFGYSAREIVGMPMSLLVPPEGDARERDLLARTLAGEDSRRVETERVRRDGRRLHVSTTVTPLLDADGVVVGASLVERDVTERRRMEAELRASREQAVEASRLKSEFVANMSHEIRTPLNGVVSMAELLLQTALDAEQGEYAQVALTSAEALMRVINDILDFSKIEAGKLEIVAEDFSLGRAVEEVCEIVGAKAGERGLALTTSFAGDVRDVVRGDGNRVRQVLLNLLSNAVKFTSEGGVAVEVSLAEAGAGDGAEHRRLRIEVADTGIGIDPERLSHLFQPFSQEDATTTRRYGGTGLGLAISKQLVELMGGTIGCTSRQGAGSTFWFELPYEPGVEADTVSPGHDLTGTRVLIVDDEPEERQALEGHLASWGISPERAADADTALKRLRRAARAGRPYEAALIAQRPGGEGLELARTITSLPALRATRLILLAAAPVDRRTATAAGIDAQVIRPLRQSRIYNALLSTLHTTRGILPPAGPAGGAAAAQTPAGGAPRAAVRVLVAEDNEVNQVAAIRLLQAFGISVDIARNGREAVAMSARGSHAAVFMDCQMPEMDGYTASRAIRGREEATGGHVPIVALTAHALEGDRAMCLAAGMDEYLTKPLRLQAIQELIERVPALRSPAADPAADDPTDEAETGAAAGDPTDGPAAGTDAETGAALVDPTPLAELGDAEAAATLATLFLNQAAERMPALGEALATNDARRVHELAHGLSGSAATVGAGRMSELARALSDLAQAGLAPAAAGLHGELTAAFDATGAALHEHIRRLQG